MSPPQKVRLTALAKTGGCGCKIAPARLRGLLDRAGVLAPPNAPGALMADARHADDAAVWRLSEDCAAVCSADFFAPLVDDPRDFGRIAAANAISDIYAMGARPLFALSLLAMPDEVADEDVAEILAGGADCCRDAGVALAGGHSIAAAEPLFGLSVTGTAHPDRIMSNGGARPGDALILGKPLGTGLLAAACRRGELDETGYRLMVQTIAMLNRAGERMPDIGGAHAMTDVTGFGLLGHALEMCRASGCGASIDFDRIPLLPRARELAESGLATGASARNWEGCAEQVRGAPPGWRRTILTDPQTGGGLLIACAPEAAPRVLELLCACGCENAAVIGEAVEGEGIEIAGA